MTYLHQQGPATSAKQSQVLASETARVVSHVTLLLHVVFSGSSTA